MVLKRLSDFANKIRNGFFNMLEHNDKLVYFVIITILSLFLRVLLFDCIKWDFEGFLQPWYERIYNGGFKELGTSFGDYTPAYYYLLWILSLFRFEPDSMSVLYGIKTISIIFDYVLAVFAMLSCYELTKNKSKSILCYTLVVFGLTVFLNSSLWGQCDAIYASMCVATLYFLLKGKPNTSMIFYGIAFSFKLQSIFILPIIIVLFLRKGFKLKYLLWIPLIYIAFAIPSCLVADNFFTRLIQILAVYVNQSAASYKEIALNCGSFYSLIFTNFKQEDFVQRFALFLAIAVIGSYMFFIYRSKEKFTPKTWLSIATLFVLLCPYILPHMHERYFYIADILVCIYALVNPKKFYVAILAITNSMIGYMVYLWNIPFINVVPQESVDGTKALSFRFGAIIYLIAIIIVSIDLFKTIYPNGLKDEEDSKLLN